MIASIFILISSFTIVKYKKSKAIAMKYESMHISKKNFLYDKSLLRAQTQKSCNIFPTSSILF